METRGQNSVKDIILFNKEELRISVPIYVRGILGTVSIHTIIRGHHSKKINLRFSSSNNYLHDPFDSVIRDVKRQLKENLNEAS